MPPSISVILLAYREPDFLNGLLENLAQQTLPPAEIIIIDDASGEEFTSRYRLPQSARLIVNPQNIAIAAVSRNIALRQARGEFIAFVDQDDRWHPEKLAIQAAALSAAPDALLHHTHLQNVDEHLQPLAKQPHFRPLGADPLAALLKSNSIAYSSVMVRRTAFDRAGLFDESIRAAADWDMWLRIAGATGAPNADPQNRTRSVSEGQNAAAHSAGPSNIRSDPRPLLLRRHHPRQWSNSALMMAHAGERVIAKAAQWVPEKRPDLTRLVTRRHARWLRELARAQLAAGKPRSDARASLSQALRRNPLDLRAYALLARTLLPARPAPPQK